ncbi:proline--tRNA ligase [candidate division WWE3 bacterium]|nr:proline--tRNA ligase [candidate division WWE3 bacterium]
MKYSSIFGKTVKTVPAELSAISHKLLYQGGFIRDISTGRYAFLPLGMKVRQKIMQIIEEELKETGSQLVVTPTLHPIEFWTATNRDKAFGSEMLIVEDHHGATFAIGGTAEGMMVELVKKFKPSYRDLPIRIHQYSEKFRDEKRPRGGLLRVREFIMKDAYSFDSSEEAMMESYWAFYNAYQRIFARLELEAIPIEADSGAIGGDFNHEFIVKCDVGEGSAFTCTRCEYRAHEDRAEFHRDNINLEDEELPMETIEQPEWVKTMEDNEKHYGLPQSRYLKNVVFKDDNDKLIIAVMRGDLEANPAKIKKVLGLSNIDEASDEDLKRIGSKPGYVHSWGYKDVTMIGDLSLTTVKNFIGGQKTDTHDTKNVNYGRDFQVDMLADIALAPDGAECTRCSGKLKLFKGIEVGHVFKFDDFYTKPMGGTFTNDEGELKSIFMGSYGIGIGRAMATIVETHHDEKGIMWPWSVAPFHAHIVQLSEDLEVAQLAKHVHDHLERELGWDVLLDDRTNVTAGEKFSDADLLGLPLRIVVSRKTIAQDQSVEVRRRDSNESILIPTGNDFNERIIELVENLPS